MLAEIAGLHDVPALQSLPLKRPLSGQVVTNEPVVGSPELQPDFPDAEVTLLDIVPGPRADWFDAAALDSLCFQDWEVTPQSNRVGMRLAGVPLTRNCGGELPSGSVCASGTQSNHSTGRKVAVASGLARRAG